MKQPEDFKIGSMYVLADVVNNSTSTYFSKKFSGPCVFLGIIPEPEPEPDRPGPWYCFYANGKKHYIGALFLDIFELVSEINNES